MVYMRFERGHTAVTNGCADRAAGPQFFSNVGGVQSEKYRPPSSQASTAAVTALTAYTDGLSR